MICLTPKPHQNFFVYCIQSKQKSFTEELFKERGVGWGIEQKNQKDGFLTALAKAIKK